jgi:hypothetical protein
MNGQWMVLIWMTPSLSPSSGPVAGRIKLGQWFPTLLSDSAMPKYLSEWHVQVYHHITKKQDMCYAVTSQKANSSFLNKCDQSHDVLNSALNNWRSLA